LLLPSCTGNRGGGKNGNTASRAERASIFPREEKDHAFSQHGSMKETGIAY
jgi:hypothetical protein